MSDKKDNKFTKELTIENFKNYILDLERENIRDISKEDKPRMVQRIIKAYEEAKKNDNH